VLCVSQRALDELQDALEANFVETGIRLGFRILALPPRRSPARAAEEPGLPLQVALDEPGADDDVVWCGERPILILERSIAELLDGFLLDVVETPDGDAYIAIDWPEHLF
jgi:hypothetical protein